MPISVKPEKIFDRCTNSQDRGATLYRIKKLLQHEYCDFDDEILVEAPFAETSRSGRGLREVTLGLTPTKLIVATDVISKNCGFSCPRGIDHSIESFELVSVYPLKYVILSVFHRRHKKTLKARLVNGRINYYEIGGMEQRALLWKRWCEEIRKLGFRKKSGSSQTETTAASSSSISTVYLVPSDTEPNNHTCSLGNRKYHQVWVNYGGAGDGFTPTWPNKSLYLGPSYDELGDGTYVPNPVKVAGGSLDELRKELRDYSSLKSAKQRSSHSWPMSCNCPKSRDRRCKCPCKKLLPSKEDKLTDLRSKTLSVKLPREKLVKKCSRFGMGVDEKCNSVLCLDYKQRREIIQQSYKLMDPYKLVESGVAVWESCSKKVKHRRRYGLASAPHFLRALGPWSVRSGERESVQLRRASSLVAIRRQPLEPELKLPVSRRQLTTSVSSTALGPGRCRTMGQVVNKGQVILFWTPDYWYRPRPATVAYRELRQHLTSIREFMVESERSGKKKKKKKQRESNGIFRKIFSSSRSCSTNHLSDRHHEDSTTDQLKRLLRMDMRISAWDFSSGTLAEQLTLIDRNLFARIPVQELEILIYQRSSRNTPNVGAWVAFSHRISCLITSEILAIDHLEMRTRVLARLINVADKCLNMGNFNSCRSVLAGVQSPPIFRLKKTWARLRKHHATKYAAVERLSKLFKTTSSDLYKNCWIKAERTPPHLPYIGDVLARILGLDDEKEEINSQVKRLRSNETILKLKNVKKLEQSEESPCEDRSKLLRAVVKMFTGGKSKKCQSREFVVNNENCKWTERQLQLVRIVCSHWQRLAVERRLLKENVRKLADVDVKKKRAVDIGNWLMACQRHSQCYSITKNSLANEFILKARYREDKENFFISLQLEPSKT